ncbi:hypothetical protein VP01_9020g1, partial [Puccinia sorghi]
FERKLRFMMAPDWWQEAQAKWQAKKINSNSNGCEITAKKDSFEVLKDGITRFRGKVENNLFAMDNPDRVGGSVTHTANFSQSQTDSLRSIHERFERWLRVQSLLSACYQFRDNLTRYNI